MKVKVNKNQFQTTYEFYCPGCKCHHAYRTEQMEGQVGPIWQFNDDTDKPTFTPSLLYRSDFKHDPRQAKNICHIYMTNGVISFLGDCTHEFAGKTYEMPDIT